MWIFHVQMCWLRSYDSLNRIGTRTWRAISITVWVSVYMLFYVDHDYNRWCPTRLCLLLLLYHNVYNLISNKFNKLVVSSFIYHYVVYLHESIALFFNPYEWAVLLYHISIIFFSLQSHIYEDSRVNLYWVLEASTIPSRNFYFCILISFQSVGFLPSLAGWWKEARREAQEIDITTLKLLAQHLLWIGAYNRSCYPWIHKSEIVHL